jgi:hypothetical protein
MNKSLIENVHTGVPNGHGINKLCSRPEWLGRRGRYHVHPGEHSLEPPSTYKPISYANSLCVQKLLYAGLIFSNSGQLFTKSTFFFQFYRIIRSTGSPLRVPYISIITIICCWLIAQVILSAVPCIPVQYFWDKTIEGYCPDSTPERWMSSVGNIVTDFVILLLPVPVIWRLRIAKGQKLALGAVFGLGFL